MPGRARASLAKSVNNCVVIGAMFTLTTCAFADDSSSRTSDGRRMDAHPVFAFAAAHLRR